MDPFFSKRGQALDWRPNITTKKKKKKRQKKKTIESRVIAPGD